MLRNELSYTATFVKTQRDAKIVSAQENKKKKRKLSLLTKGVIGHGVEGLRDLWKN